MLVELDKKDLIRLIRGISPRYEQMEVAKGFGSYTGGFHDRWDWEPPYAFDKYTEDELYALYLKIKKA